MNAKLTTVWIKGDVELYQLPVLSPIAWSGESDCAVGPFTSREVVEYFISMTNDGLLESATDHIFARGDSWYVEAGLTG